jgi:hypothetical protein
MGKKALPWAVTVGSDLGHLFMAFITYTFTFP